MTCKDCYHYAVCHLEISFSMGTDYTTDKMYDDMEKRCGTFKDKSKIVEIPDIGIGQEVYFIFDKVDGKYRVRKGRIYQFQPMQVKVATEFMSFDIARRLGENAFLTKEEAEAQVRKLYEND